MPYVAPDCGVAPQPGGRVGLITVPPNQFRLLKPSDIANERLA
jgi:hypothetical protein